MLHSVPSTSDLLKRVLAQPTAPFREGWVSAEIRTILDEHEIPYFVDSVGNVIAGVSSQAELHKGFRIALMAHMDHPGFHLGPPHERALQLPLQLAHRKLSHRSSKQKKLLSRCHWYGGAPFQAMKGARVRIFDPNKPGLSVGGTIHSLERMERPVHAKDEGLPFLVAFDEDVTGFSAGAFGAFDFEGCRIKGDTVSTRAADDLAGCAIALGALIDQENDHLALSGKGKATQKGQKRRSSHQPRTLIGIFTRAEEVGFIGCLDLLMKKVLPSSVWVVSLEASKALPEAEFGHGPVLRIGDRMSLFDTEFSSVLWKVARDLESTSGNVTANASGYGKRKGKKAFRFQRRLMSGGTCEATPLLLFGHCVTAVAVPLLNYHNQNVKTARPSAEVISLSDVEGARRLCHALGANLTTKPNWLKTTKTSILNDYRILKGLLKTKVPFQETPRGF